MSITDNQDQDQRDSAGLTPAERRILQAKADRADEAESRAQAAERRLALNEAGIELDPLQRKAIEAVHDGEWTPENLRTTAEKLRFVEPQAKPDVSADEMAIHDRIAGASAGSQIKPSDREADIEARLAAAKTEKEFDEIYRSSGRPMS